MLQPGYPGLRWSVPPAGATDARYSLPLGAHTMAENLRGGS